jgi:haloalkane dehalogenase
MGKRMSSPHAPSAFAAAAALLACAGPAVSTPHPFQEGPMHDVPVLDSHMSHRELGRGPAVVFLHGNPTSSRVWRDVIPHVAPHARCLAPDLIGMGRSGKPDLAYRFADHARYLDAWFEALGLREVVLVGYDWGGALALDWAARHPDRVRGVVVFETFLRPMRWTDWPPQGAELFRALRTPGVGERMVLEENVFLARSLENGVKRGLSAEERAAYAAPYPDPASRRPVLQWPREIPIDGEPADVAATLTRSAAWLATTPTPRLLLTFDAPSVLGSPATVAWARETFAGLELVQLGPAGHHAPEDRPEEIGRAIAKWLGRRGLVTAPSR